MAQRSSLPVLAALAAAALPAHALIPLASDALHGLLARAKNGGGFEGFLSPGIRPDPDPTDSTAHQEWVRRQAAQSEAADTLLERLSDAKTSAATGARTARGQVALLPRDQFYASASDGSAQLYSEAGTLRTSAAGLRALYAAMTDARLASAPAAAAGADAPLGAAPPLVGRPFGGAQPRDPRLSAAPSGSAEGSTDAAALAAQAILPAFAPLAGAAQAARGGPTRTAGLPSAEIAGRPGTTSPRRLEAFPSAGGAAPPRDGGSGSLDDFFNGKPKTP